jgi:hypothetical protein
MYQGGSGTKGDGGHGEDMGPMGERKKVLPQLTMSILDEGLKLPIESIQWLKCYAQLPPVVAHYFAI